MKFADRSIKWAVVIVILTLVLVVSGYCAGMFLQGKAEGEALAANEHNTQEYTVGEIENSGKHVEEYGDDANNSKAADPDEEDNTRLTTGSVCSKKLVDDGTVNLLILGEDKISFLYDTIGIVSINKADSKPSQTSPRDNLGIILYFIE